MRSFRAKRQEVSNMLRHAESFGLSKEAKQRLHWFAYALAHEGNISLTCRYFGISRSTFLRWAKRFNSRDPQSLEEHSRRPHSFRKPETPQDVIALIRTYRETYPSMSKETIVLRLLEEHHITLSASSVGRVIRREKLFFGESTSHARKRAGVDLTINTNELRAAPSSRASGALRQGSGQAGEDDALSATDFPLLGS
jgi:hypothetical protein